MPLCVSNKEIENVMKSYPEDSVVGAIARELLRLRKHIAETKARIQELSHELALGTDLVDAKAILESKTSTKH